MNNIKTKEHQLTLCATTEPRILSQYLMQYSYFCFASNILTFCMQGLHQNGAEFTAITVTFK